MLNLCEYRDMFAKPNTGPHQYRIFNIAIVDVVLTILLAYGISWFFNYPFLPTLGISFFIGIIAHRLFCVRTTVDKFLFPIVDDRE